MILKIILLKSLRFLFHRCNQKSRWFFLIIALPFAIFGLWGWEYGAFFIYLIPALLCILHFFYPTMFGWSIITALYSVGVIAYLYGFANDVLRLIRRLKPHIFISFYDSIVFAIIIIALVSITIGLFKLRPSARSIVSKTAGG